MEKEAIERLIYGKKRTPQRRHLQDSPVLLDVWTALCKREKDRSWTPLKVLLEPNKDCNPGRLAKASSTTGRRNQYTPGQPSSATLAPPIMGAMTPASEAMAA